MEDGEDSGASTFNSSDEHSVHLKADDENDGGHGVTVSGDLIFHDDDGV